MMKAKALATAMDMVDGSVGTDDVVEIDGSIIRAADDNWWTTVDAGEDLGESMVLPYSVLRAILKAFPDEGLVSLSKKYDNCVVKRELSAKERDLGQSQVVWRLNLMDVTLDKEPEFKDVEPGVHRFLRRVC